MHIYHYHAQNTEGNVVTTIDGILRCQFPVTTMARYKEVKASIAKDMDPHLLNLVITSLTPLYVTDE